MSDFTISFGNLQLAYTGHGDRAECLLDFAFHHQQSSLGIDTPLHHIDLSEDSSGELVVLQDDLEVSRSTSDAVTALRLIERATYAFADRCTGGPVLHGGCVARDGQGTLLVGGSGSGKTCLTTWLLSRGLDYLTDELVYLSDLGGSPTCHGFARPLNLKTPAKALFPELTESQAALTNQSGSLIPPDAALTMAERPGKVASQAGLSRIIFPSFRANGIYDFLPLTKARAVLLLMQNLVNARNLPEHGFRLITALCQAVPAYSLRYSSFDQIDPLHLTQA